MFAGRASFDSASP